MDASERRRIWNAVPSLFLMLLILTYAYLILLGEGRAPVPQKDQAFILFDLNYYPHLSWSGGISGNLLVGLYKFLMPTSIETLNWHIKILSATLFLSSVFWLTRTYNLDRYSQVAVLAIVASSGLLMLEPSTDVLAGAFLNFFAISIYRPRRAILQGVLLAVFSLIKIELLPLGVIIATFWIVTSDPSTKARLTFLLAYTGSLAALILPSVYLYGVKGTLLGRDLVAFAGNYCTLFHPESHEWNCLAQAMPDVRTMRDVVRNHTQEYFDFLATATKESLHNILLTFNLLALSPLLIIRPAFMSFQSEDRNLARLTLLVLLLTFVITFPVAFVHPRYLTRSFGLLLVTSFLALRDVTGQNAATWAVIGLTTIIVAGNLLHIGEFFAALGL